MKRRSSEASAPSMEDVTGPGPGAPLPPTLIYAAGFLLSVWIETHLPLGGGQTAVMVVELLGWTFVAAGSLLFLWGMATFSKMRTGIMLQHPATKVVEEPPYSWSRNPMYVAFTVIYVGMALAFGLWWPLLVLPLVIVVLTTAVIAREERYMRATFGEAYEDYCRRVRRWM